MNTLQCHFYPLTALEITQISRIRMQKKIGIDSGESGTIENSRGIHAWLIPRDNEHTQPRKSFQLPMLMDAQADIYSIKNHPPIPQMLLIQNWSTKSANFPLKKC